MSEVHTVGQDEDGNPAVGLPMEVVETKDLCEALGYLGARLDLDDLEKLVRAYNQLEATAPIFDPTAWMKVGKNLEGHKKLAEAVLQFRQALEDLKGL